MNARFDCLVEVDPRLKDAVTVEWYKDQAKLELDYIQDETIENGTEISPEGGIELSRFRLMPNNSLYIMNPIPEDLGTYRCQIMTAIDDFTMEAVLYSESDWNWLLILIIIIICVLILILCILCIVCVRKRARRKGRYGVKDVADGKRHNR